MSEDVEFIDMFSLDGGFYNFDSSLVTLFEGWLSQD